MKRTFYTELAYVIGLALLALGTALMEAADFGVSMVVAPAYLVYLKLSQTCSFVTFGIAEYILQAILLLGLFVVVRKVRISYFFSFVTAVIYGILLDNAMRVVALIPCAAVYTHVIFFVSGMLCCALGVSMLFHTYIAPEVYELFVKEVSKQYNVDINKFKTAYDCTSCIVAIIMSFAFFGFGHFEGINIGTVICALLNGTTIGMFTRLLEKYWQFKDGTNMRKVLDNKYNKI